MILSLQPFFMYHYFTFRKISYHSWQYLHMSVFLSQIVPKFSYSRSYVLFLVPELVWYLTYGFIFAWTGSIILNVWQLCQKLLVLYLKRVTKTASLLEIVLATKIACLWTHPKFFNILLLLWYVEKTSTTLIPIGEL